MEVVMKNFSLMLLSVALTFNILFAADNSQNELANINENSLNRGADNYLIALDRDNAGIVESAICNIMIMKLYFPERDYDKFITKLSQLVTEGTTKPIRYKAFIACNYLKHPERYTWIKSDTLNNTVDFFNLFSEKLAQQLEKTEDSLLVLSR